ncbi:MAG: cellulase family glycosylhydrolase [Deltaproteobacteria bacterium]|nr:cellulase family glycosylhydrolase [Deltaproteobacteria bacterium]
MEPSGTAAVDSSGDGTVADECASPIAAASLPSARLQIAPDGRLRDNEGREVVMRGLNTGGRSKFAPFLPFDVEDPGDLAQVRAEADVYFGRMAGWGLDTVRMPFSWEALEPRPGAYDPSYLARYEVLLDAAWERRLRVIVDFHQDVYASPFCGDGFPVWSVPTPDPTPPTHDCRQWFAGYFANDDVRESFDRFWSDADGLQAPFMAMWLTMVEAVGDHPAVVGFEPMNEPGWGTMDDIDAFQENVLRPWYAEVAAQLRAVAPEILVFYDGPGVNASGGGSHFRPQGEGLAYAPHLYDPGLLLGTGWGGVDPTSTIVTMGQFGREARVPVLLGEFGYTHGARGGNEWLDLVVDALDDQRMSSTLWEYSTSFELWNGEDLSVTDPRGAERPILDAYVRPWVRAAAGEAVEVAWDRSQGRFEASWTATEGVTEIVVPARVHPNGPGSIELIGPGSCYTWDAARSELRVTAPAGTAVTVRL